MRFDLARWRQVQFDLALEVYLLSQEHTERVVMTFTGLNPEDIKAVVADSQMKAQRRVAMAMQTYKDTANRAGTAVAAALENYAAKVDKETEAQLHALAAWTNGAETFEVDPDKKPPDTKPDASTASTTLQKVNLIEPAPPVVLVSNNGIVEPAPK